jgi:3-keto-5-aminohexanoate cleavage enzyme
VSAAVIHVRAYGSLAMGGNARTGMEDALLVRRGVAAHSNAELVERLAAAARALEREPDDVGYVQEALALRSPRHE